MRDTARVLVPLVLLTGCPPLDVDAEGGRSEGEGHAVPADANDPSAPAAGIAPPCEDAAEWGEPCEDGWGAETGSVRVSSGPGPVTRRTTDVTASPGAKPTVTSAAPAVAALT